MNADDTDQKKSRRPLANTGLAAFMSTVNKTRFLAGSGFDDGMIFRRRETICCEQVAIA